MYEKGKAKTPKFERPSRRKKQKTMTTPEIAALLEEAARLMEFHNENPFKIKAYKNAVSLAEKTDLDWAKASREELIAEKGIGKSMADAILDIRDTGSFAELNSLRRSMPEGLLELFLIPGLGPKKIRQLRDELGVESPGELSYACRENRLAALKGFGEKTQHNISRALDFYAQNRGWLLYPQALGLVNEAGKVYNGARWAVCGALARGCEVVNKPELLVCSNQSIRVERVTIHLTEEAEFNRKKFVYSCSDEHLSLLMDRGFNPEAAFASEEQVYKEAGLPFVPPEMRENHPLSFLEERCLDLGRHLNESHIQGVVHVHSNWSDGTAGIDELAGHCKALGYSYMGLTDHSQSAGYAGGLKPDKVLRQWEVVRTLNESLQGFTILCGIESDILTDGRLDYADELLSGFDFVVASVHSVLRMDKQKATDRLIKAIENPYTNILGHLSGRLLLSREGYPLDMEKITDACAANGVAIELNASPYRLDIDWRLIPLALEKGVLISINPDAHSLAGVQDIAHGVRIARKAGLFIEECLNAKSLDGFKAWLNK